MTYRTMQGLGMGPTPTSDQIGALLKAINTQGGCTTTFKNTMAAIPCLNHTILSWFGACMGGVKPGNMTQAEYDSACASISACGGFNKLGCPDDGAELMASMASSMPACWTAEQYKDAGPTLDYCRAHPAFDGPNKSQNMGCWSLSRYPDLYSKVMNIPMCVQMPPPVVVAPPPPPPPPPVVTAPSADTPTDVPVDAPDTSIDTSAPPEGMSTTTMVVIGVGAVAVIGGLGYMLLRKK